MLRGAFGDDAAPIGQETDELAHVVAADAVIVAAGGRRGRDGHHAPHSLARCEHHPHLVADAYPERELQDLVPVWDRQCARLCALPRVAVATLTAVGSWQTTARLLTFASHRWVGNAVVAPHGV